MTWLIRIILLVLILGFIRWIVSYFSGVRTPPPNRSSKRREKMVRDPVCGTFVASSLALPAKRQGEMFYFCSEKCRNEYLSTPREVV